MATLDHAALQLAELLPVEAVPAKLRCASCNKLAVNAVKLPCCDQSVCEPCSQDLPETCPICSHSPIAVEDCKPNKSLRMTVKAFIKSEEKKRSKDVEAPPAQTVEPTDTPQPSDGHAVAAAPEAEASGTPVDGMPTELQQETLPPPGAVSTEEASADVASIANEHPTQPRPDPEDGDDDEEEDDDDDDVIITTERPETEQAEEQPHARDEVQTQDGYGEQYDHSQMNGAQEEFGYDSNQQSFNNMDFNSMNMNGFNPMMAMQNGGMNGMPNFGMMQSMMGEYNFNLRGSPHIPRSRLRGANHEGMPMGMTMDPSMMFPGGFGGMGDMSMMGMGMNGMGGMGNFGVGMGMGGTNGPASGFYPGNAQGGYMNQQNFGNNMHQNFHHNRGYGGRPYGRGFGRSRGWGSYNRGGGRGGWQNHGQYQQNQDFMNQPYQQQGSQHGHSYRDSSDAGSHQQAGRRGSPSYEPMKDPSGASAAAVTNPQPHQADTKKDENINAVGDDATNGAEDDAGKDHADAEGAVRAVGEDAATEGAADQNTNAEVSGASMGAAIESVAVAGAAQDDFGNRVDGGQQNQKGFGYGPRGRGGFRGSGGAYGYVATAVGEPASVEAPPVNAPTGPKAMREGLPNSGWYSRPQQHAPVPTAASAVKVSTPLSEAERAKQSEYHERDGPRSRSYSNSGHVSRKESRRSRDDDYDSEEESRLKERERRKRKERERKYDDERNAQDSSSKGRSRSESPSDDHSRRRHRDKDDEHRSSRSHRDRSREKRRHRHRSRSHDRTGSVNGDDHESTRRKSERRHRESEYRDDEQAKEKSKSSRRSSKYDAEEYDYESKDYSKDSSRHGRSSRDERHRDRDRDKHRPVLEEPQDDIGFKIKGRKSASIQAGVENSMAPPPSRDRDRSHRRTSVHDSGPPTPSTPSADPYAEERERRQRERLDRENTLRRQSTQSLGKRLSRDGDEELEAPTGPRDADGRAGKKVRRKMAYKYEDEIGYAR